MNATFSKGQHVHGEYRGQFYKGVITNVTARDTDMVVSVKLDAEIVCKGELNPRDKFMTAVDADGDFTASAYPGYMTLVSEDVQPTDELAAQEPTEYAAFTTTTAHDYAVSTTIRKDWPETGYVVEVTINNKHHATEFAEDTASAERRQRYMHDDAVKAFGGYPVVTEPALKVLSVAPMPDVWLIAHLPIADLSTQPETPRIKRLRATIERLQREMDSVNFELEQELGQMDPPWGDFVATKEQLLALRWLAAPVGTKYEITGITVKDIPILKDAGLIRLYSDTEYDHDKKWHISDAGRAYLESVK